MEKLYGWGLPIDVSTHGWQIDRLIYIVHAVMAVLFIGWFLFLVFAIFRFRQKPGHKAEYHTKHFKAPTYLEAGVVVTEVVLLLAFSFPIWSTVTQKFPDRKDALSIRVVAEQFAWNIHYPGADGVFGKAKPALMNSTNPLGLDLDDPNALDDVSTINQMNIPIDTPVIVEVSSKDVIHSFALPVMRIKQDAIPGQSVSMWFQAKKTGDFEIACAQLCGLGHYRMRGFFNVLEKDKFKDWMKEQVSQK